jgi:hypothetical protein
VRGGEGKREQVVRGGERGSMLLEEGEGESISGLKRGRGGEKLEEREGV